MNNMSLKQKLKSSFYSHLYKWSVSDAYREASNNFPFLSTMHHIHVAPYIDILRTFPQSCQTDLFVALTKISFQKSGEYSQIELSPYEKSLLKSYQQKLGKFPQYATELHQAYYVEKRFFKIAVKKLNDLVCTELNPVFDAAAIAERDYLQYWTFIDTRWHLSTSIHLDSTGIAYDHLLSFLPQASALSSKERYQQRLVFSNPISLPRWLGFRDGSWIFFNQEDPLIAAKTVALACSHFLGALPNLLMNVDTASGDLESQV